MINLKNIINKSLLILVFLFFICIVILTILFIINYITNNYLLDKYFLIEGMHDMSTLFKYISDNDGINNIPPGESEVTKRLCSKINNDRCSLDKYNKCKIMKDKDKDTNNNSDNNSNTNNTKCFNALNEQQRNIAYICDNKTICPTNCKIPDKISECNCHPHVFKNPDGTYFRMCYYECNKEDNTDNLDKCKDNICCRNCGYIKFNIDENGEIIGDPVKIPLDNDIIPNDYDNNSDIIINIKNNKFIGFDGRVNYEYPGEGKAIHPPTKPPKQDQNTIGSTLKEAYSDIFKKSKNDKKFPCRKTATGMFTDCGPLPAKGDYVGFSEFYK